MSKPNGKVTEFLPYHFTRDEKRDIADALALASQQRSEVEDRKKQIVSDFKAQLDAIEATIKHKSRLYNNGYEMREIECSVSYHCTRQGMKSVFRLDTGEFVKELPMTANDLQEHLPFEDDEPADEQAQAAYVQADEEDEDADNHPAIFETPEVQASADDDLPYKPHPLEGK